MRADGMLKVSGSVIAGIVARATLAAPVAALADPAPPPPQPETHDDVVLTKTVDLAPPLL